MTEYLGLAGLILVLATVGRWFWRAWQVNIPQSPYLFQALAAVSLGLGALSLYQGYDDPFAAWAIGVSLVFLFLSATGAQKVSQEGVDVGDTIPAFTAPDDNNETFDSSSLAGSRVLLKFFRGHW